MRCLAHRVQQFTPTESADSGLDGSLQPSLPRLLAWRIAGVWGWRSGPEFSSVCETGPSSDFLHSAQCSLIVFRGAARLEGTVVEWVVVGPTEKGTGCLTLAPLLLHEL